MAGYLLVDVVVSFADLVADLVADFNTPFTMTKAKSLLPP